MMTASEGKWFAVFDTDGKLVSTGTVIDDEHLSLKGFTFKVLDENPTGKHWDGSAFVPREPPYLGVTVLDFKNRFSAEERQNLLARTNPARPGYDSVIHDFLDMLHTTAISNVRVDPQGKFVSDFLTYLVYKSYISKTRASAIGAR